MKAMFVEILQFWGDTQSLLFLVLPSVVCVCVCVCVCVRACVRACARVLSSASVTLKTSLNAAVLGHRGAPHVCPTDD